MDVYTKLFRVTSIERKKVTSAISAVKPSGHFESGMLPTVTVKTGLTMKMDTFINCQQDLNLFFSSKSIEKSNRLFQIQHTTNINSLFISLEWSDCANEFVYVRAFISIGTVPFISFQQFSADGEKPVGSKPF